MDHGFALPAPGGSEGPLVTGAPVPERYPSGWVGLCGASGRSAPVAPPARRGSPFLPRNGEKEEPRGKPLDPEVLWPACCRSLVLAFVPHCPGHGAISLPIFVP